MVEGTVPSQWYLNTKVDNQRLRRLFADLQSILNTTARTGNARRLQLQDAKRLLEDFGEIQYVYDDAHEHDTEAPMTYNDRKHEDAILQDVFWLIACEIDSASTVGHDEAVFTAENIRRRVEGHFAVSATSFPEGAS